MSTSTAPSSSAAQTRAGPAASTPAFSVNNNAANPAAPVSSNVASNPPPGSSSAASDTGAASAPNVASQTAPLPLVAIPGASGQTLFKRAVRSVRTWSKSTEVVTDGFSKSVEHVLSRGSRSASFRYGHDLESRVQTPNARPCEPVAGISKLFEAPAISFKNLGTDFDDSGLEAEFDSLSLTISKAHACLDSPADDVYEIKELWIEQNKSSYNCPIEHRWNQAKQRWAGSREIRLIKDLRTALKSLKGSKKDREFRPNLRMAGQAEPSVADVRLRPTVVIRCATEKGRKAINEQLSDLDYIANITTCVYVGLDKLKSGLLRNVPFAKEGNETVDETATDVDEHWYSRVAEELDIQAPELYDPSSCGWQVSFRLRDGSRRAVSTVGGVLLVNGIPYAITAGHSIYQLLDPDDDEPTPSQHGQLKGSLLGAAKARVEVAAMDFADAGLLNIGTSGDHPSPDPTSDFALLAIDQIRNLNQVNLYQPRHFNGISISVQKIGEKPTGGKVDIILGKDQIRKAVLEDSTSYFVQDDAILQTQALHLDAPLGKYRLELFSALLMA